MAKSAFGSYSSVPTTGGLGQGAAQVFAPQAIATDMTQFGKGLSTAAEGAAQLITDVKDKRAEIEELKKKADLQKGNYTLTQNLAEANNSKVDEIISGSYNKRGKVKIKDLKNVKEELDNIINNGNEIQAYESALTAEYQASLKQPNALVETVDENGKTVYKSYTKTLEDLLTNPPSPDLLTKFNSGALIVGANEDLMKRGGKIVNYDPNYNLDQTILEQRTKWNPGKTEEEIKAWDALTQEQRVTTASQYSTEELNRFKQSMLYNNELKRQRAERYAVENNLPKSEVDNIMNDETFNATWTEEVGKSVDASQRISTSGSTAPLSENVSKSGNGGIGETIEPNVGGIAIGTSQNPNGITETEYQSTGIINVEGYTPIYGYTWDPRQQDYVGVDQSGAINTTPQEFKSIELKYVQGLSEGDKKRYYASKNKFEKKPFTEMKWDKKVVDGSKRIIMDSKKSAKVAGEGDKGAASGVQNNKNRNTIAAEYRKLGIELGPEMLDDIVIANTNGIKAVKLPDGTYEYVSLGDNSDKRVAALEKEYGATNVRTYTPDVDSGTIASIITSVIRNDNPVSFLTKEGLGSSRDISKLDAYLKKANRKLSSEERNTAARYMAEEGLSTKSAVDKVFMTDEQKAKLEGKPTTGTNPKRSEPPKDKPTTGTNPKRSGPPKFDINAKRVNPATEVESTTPTKTSSQTSKLEEAGVPETTAKVISNVESITPKGKDLTTPETPPQVFTKENGDTLKISKPATVALNTFKDLGENLGINVPEGDMESDIATMFDNLIGEGNRKSFWENGKKAAGGDPVPSWCAAFVGNLILQNSPEELTIGNEDKFDKVRAKKYAELGTETTMDNAEIGNIIVLKAPEGYHVGIYAGLNTEGDPIVFGGNQGDSLSVVPFPKSYVTDVRKLKVNTLTKEQVEELSKFIDKDLLVEGTKVI